MKINQSESIMHEPVDEQYCSEFLSRPTPYIHSYSNLLEFRRQDFMNTRIWLQGIDECYEGLTRIEYNENE